MFGKLGLELGTEMVPLVDTGLSLELGALNWPQLKVL